MAVDKLVDSTQLDADLTSVANAIRTKGGTSADLAFPAGFVSAVEAIPTGGGGDDRLTLLLSKQLVDLTLTETTLTTPYTFSSQSNLESVSAPNCLTISGSATNIFENCPKLASISFPKMYQVSSAAFSKSIVSVVVLPSIEEIYGNAFLWCTSLTIADLGPKVPSHNYSKLINAQYVFQHCTNLNTIILRQETKVAGLSNINAFGYTPFASGGTGGTLYVPSALISSYQSATNWSTILGYTNNQIKSIESTHTDPNAPIDLTLYYADGTPIT